MENNRFVLIDAFALIHRAFHALPPLTTSDGKQVNAVYGFTSALLSAIQSLQPEYLICAFDLPKPTKRHIEYVEYKAHRAKAPDELVVQIPYIKEVLSTMNIPIVSAEGYEGEDVIATIVAKIRNPKSEARPSEGKSFNKSKILNSKNRNNSSSFEFRYSNFEFIIVTGDTDVMQLVDEDVKVYSMARGRRPEGRALPGGVNQAIMYDIEKVREKYGILPDQFVDYKALKGDASDNIPGVPGIGEKTAVSLIREFGTLEKLYNVIARIRQLAETKQSDFQSHPEHSERILDRHVADAPRDDTKKSQNKTKLSEKVLRLLKENKDQAILSQKLSKIADDAPIDFNLADARVHDFDQKEVVKLFEKYNFRSLIKRLPASHRQDLQQKLL